MTTALISAVDAGREMARLLAMPDAHIYSDITTSPTPRKLLLRFTVGRFAVDENLHETCLQLPMKDFSDRHIRPAMRRLQSLLA